MIRLLAFLPAWWYLQLPSQTLWKEGIGIGMVVLIVWLWERDSKRRVAAVRESDKRYSMLVEKLFEHDNEFKTIIQGNTTAMTTLADRLVGKINNCPFAADPVMNKWVRAWAEHSLENMERQQRHSGTVEG